MRGSPSSEAVGIQGLLEVPLVVVQHAQAPGLAPELPNEERQHREGGQTDWGIHKVQESEAARRLWPVPTVARVGPTKPNRFSTVRSSLLLMKETKDASIEMPKHIVYGVRS